MTWAEWAVLVGAVLAVLLWAVWIEASRIDRLHRKVAASLATLETQLVRRATVAVELASTGVLDPVSSVLVGEAALAALDATGRDTDEMTPVPADLARLVGPAYGDWSATPGTPGTSGTVARGAVASRTEPSAAAVERGLTESELSATLRAALGDPREVAAVRAQPGGADLVAALAAAWFRVQLARRFHNEAVAQTRRVRQKTLVRALRLAGHAPLPHTFDIDDAWPPALGRPGALGSTREV